MSAVAMIGPKFYGWDQNGKPLAGGKLYTYEAGTTTPKTTWTDETQTTANPNPVVLNSEGFADVYLSGSYNLVLNDSTDVQRWTQDNVSSSSPTGWVVDLAATYVSTTVFSVVGNYTADYLFGRAIRIDNNTGTFVYSHIAASSYAGGITTVVVEDAVIAAGVQFTAVSIIVPESLPSNLDSVTSILKVWNATGSTLSLNDLVYTGAWNIGGDAVEANLADSDGVNTWPVAGLVTADIATGTSGTIVTQGFLFNQNTSAYADRDTIYMSSTPGAWTATRPTGRTEKVQSVVKVIRTHATEGIVQIVGAGRVNDVDNEVKTILNTKVSCSYFGRSKETVDQLKDCNGETDKSYIDTLGYSTEGDGGGGKFYWDIASTLADNGGTIIKATAISTGRWLRVYSGPVIAKWFGAKGDGATNDTIAIQGAESVIGVTEIYLTEGTYIVTSYTLTKTYRGEGFISVDGIVQRQNPDWSDLQPNGGRSIIRYYDYNDVFVTDKHFTMSEFRVAGQYTRLKAPSWSTTANTTLISTDTNTFGSMLKHASNWYGAFACANGGDVTVSTQATPFLRARSVAGSVVTLGYAGIGDDELGPIPVAATYTWTPSELVGTKVLVVSEGTLVGKLNILGSRVTTITAATTTTITLDDVGSIGVRDYLLPAPSGFEFFKYLGSVYRDTNEVFNIYDTGSLVMNRGVANANFTNNYQGSQPTAVAIKVGGYIPPLATAVVIHSKYTIASASTGDVVENFGGDVSHMTDVRYEGKYNTGNQSVRHSNMTVPFLWRQEYAYSNGGSLAGIKGYDEHYPWGWIEN